MNRTKEIQTLHNKGFVILRAQRSTNAPVGWKNKSTGKWGYVDEMNDPSLSKYKTSFNAELTAKSHCGFYLGFADLCCIDLDVKKTKEPVKAIVDKLIKELGGYIAVETTKSNGYHIYFRFKTDEPNDPDWMKLRKENWIEVYYRKRFIASYLSNSKRYTLIHGSVLDLKHIPETKYEKLLKPFLPYQGKRQKLRKRKQVVIDQETWKRTTSFVEQIEAQGLDITGDNPKWFRIGKSFASAFGEKGFDLFNRVSRFSPKYNEDTIQDDYQNFVTGDLRDRGTKITIATFFHLCEEAGLLSLEQMAAQSMHPAVSEKEFTLVLTKKEKMPEHVHILCEEFKKNVYICCVDKANFFVFETTHWIQRNTKEVMDLVDNFIDRSDMEDDKYRLLLRTMPYREMILKELYMTTLRNSLEPYTGNLYEGIYINIENGVLHINLQTGKRKLLDHEAKYNFTTMLPYAYDPLAQCPKFDAWISKQIPNQELHVAYYAFVASCLTKHKSDIIMLLAGETSTGKSSLIDITRRVIGLENSVPISAATLFSGKSDAAAQVMQMENKLLAYDFDAQPFKNPEIILKAAAQEPLMGWQMNIARRPVTNYGRILIAMNPYNYSVFNAAIARRFITINMDVPVVKDNSVMPSIYENELAGIFNHVINEGVKHLIENNGIIKQTESMKQATLSFHTKQRDAVRWFNETYELPSKPEDRSNKKSLKEKLTRSNNQPVTLITMRDLYNQFRAWCEDDEGIHVTRIPIKKHFTQDLEVAGVKESVLKINGKPTRGLYVARVSPL